MAKEQKALFGVKLGMTQAWDSKSRFIPITVVRVDTNVINRIKTNETDGYNAIQLSYGSVNPRKVNKPDKGQFAEKTPKKHLSEVRVEDISAYQVGQEFNVNSFESGQKIDVVGTSKGKGFAGVMKRHGFHGVSATHGAHLNHRKPGSIGACATPGRVFKGLKMAGRMGADRVTIQNLAVHSVDNEKGLLLIAGAVPGPNNSVIQVKSAVKGL